MHAHLGIALSIQAPTTIKLGMGFVHTLSDYCENLIVLSSTLHLSMLCVVLYFVVFLRVAL